jgi:hypothetical protein
LLTRSGVTKKRQRPLCGSLSLAQKAAWASLPSLAEMAVAEPSHMLFIWSTWSWISEMSGEMTMVSLGVLWHRPSMYAGSWGARGGELIHTHVT